MKRTVIFSLALLFLASVSAQQQAVPQQPQRQAAPQQEQRQTPLSIYQNEMRTTPYKVKHKVAKQRRLATRQGVRDLDKKNNSNAVSSFRKALQGDSSYAKPQYNLALAHSRLHQNDSALHYYEKVCKNSSSTPELRAKAHYNAGNIHLRQALAARDTGGYDPQNLQASIEQYKAALRLDSDNADAQHNLSLAKQLLRPSQQGGGGQSQQQNQNQQNQQQNQQQQNQDQQNQDQQNQQQQSQQQDQQQNQQQGGQQDKQDKKQQEQRRREAEQMLNAMKNNEQQTMRQMRMKEAEKERRQGTPARIEKDW